MEDQYIRACIDVARGGLWRSVQGQGRSFGPESRLQMSGVPRAARAIAGIRYGLSGPPLGLIRIEGRKSFQRKRGQLGQVENETVEVIFMIAG